MANLTCQKVCSWQKNHKHKEGFLLHILLSDGKAVQIPIPKGQSGTGRNYRRIILNKRNKYYYNLQPVS